MSATSDSNESSSPIKVLGVCGGIGSGKSQACKLLVSDLGCVSHIGEYYNTQKGQGGLKTLF
jgi:dephospho-CoA kinase